jgi:hypothetical protein
MKSSIFFMVSLFASVMLYAANVTTDPTLQLKKIVPSNGELVPGFSSPRLSYQLKVSHAVSEISFDLGKPGEDLRITINDVAFSPSGKFQLEVGINHIYIKLLQGQKENKYTIEVLRDHALPNWRNVLSKGPFHIRDSGGELVFKDRMWLFGGYFPELSADVWSSKDGVNWEEHPSIPTKAGINIPVQYVYKGKMWIVSNDGELFSSADGNQWELVNAKPAWGKRYAAGGVVFKGKMWLFGGHQDRTLKNDIWSSEDGVNWKKAPVNAPWSPRQLFGNVVVKDDKIWIIGGGVTDYFPFKAYRDVWVSSDGINWKEVSDEAPWPARIWSNCVVYHNRIFLLGGFRSQPVWENRGDVWYSKDGKEWTQLKTDLSWDARHEHSSYVFKNNLWVVGGNKWPLLNDVWSLDINGLSFLSQPVLQELKGAGYKYYAKADFNKSGLPIVYRLKEAPKWLQVKPQTGILSGIPTEKGNYKVVLEAYDTAGEKAEQSFVIEVK